MRTINLYLLILSVFLLIWNKIFAQGPELLGPPGAVWEMQIHSIFSEYLYSSDAHNGSIFRTTDGGLTGEFIDPQNFNYINQLIASIL